MQFFKWIYFYLYCQMRQSIKKGKSAALMALFVTTVAVVISIKDLFLNLSAFIFISYFQMR